MLLNPPEFEVSTLLLLVLKEMGGVMLMLSVMLFFAYRDPARNVAFIIALSVGLYILAITPLLSLYTLDIRRLYPSSMIWARSWCGSLSRCCCFICAPDRCLVRMLRKIGT